MWLVFDPAHHRSCNIERESKTGGIMKHSRTSIEREFRSIVGNQLGLQADSLPGGATLSALGFDRTGLLGLVYAVEGHFDITIRNRALPGAFTLDDIISWLEMTIDSGRGRTTEPVMAEGAD
jgi:acyl carrier protein